MSRVKLVGLLAISVAVVAISGGAVFAAHQAQAQTPQSSQASVDKPEPGDQPDKSGQVNANDQQDKNGQQDAETND